MEGSDKFKVFLLILLILIAIGMVLLIADGTSDFAYVMRDFFNIKHNIKISY